MHKLPTWPPMLASLLRSTVTRPPSCHKRTRVLIWMHGNHQEVNVVSTHRFACASYESRSPGHIRRSRTLGPASDRLWELRSRTTAMKRLLMADHGGHTSVLGYDKPSGANTFCRRNQVPSFGFAARSNGSSPRPGNILSLSKGHGRRSRQSLVFHSCPGTVPFRFQTCSTSGPNFPRSQLRNGTKRNIMKHFFSDGPFARCG